MGRKSTTEEPLSVNPKIDAKRRERPGARVFKSRPLTGTERTVRWQRNRDRKEREALLEQRRATVAVLNAGLTILPKAIVDIDATDLASESVDAIITDPPYPEADLYVYPQLADFAARVLKPSGWCVVLVGNLFLPRILAGMERPDLIWRGQWAITFPGGGHSRIMTTRTFQNWKPLLLYQKPSLAPLEWGPDLIRVDAADQDKSLHDWQQSEPLFAKLIERFTRPGALVVDPFAGSGTTLRAAVSIGRHAWGCDDGSAEAREFAA